MADKSKEKSEQDDTSDERKTTAEATTSTYQIKDAPIEKFTKVSNFFISKFLKFKTNFRVFFTIIYSLSGWHGIHCRSDKGHKRISIECVTKFVLSVSRIQQSHSATFRSHFVDNLKGGEVATHQREYSTVR